MRKVLVIGCGISGKAVIQHCLDQGDSVVAVDRKILGDSVVAVDKKSLGDALCPLFQEDHTFAPFDFDLVVVSPGVKLDHPQVASARELGIEVIGESELALREWEHTTVGITGTNGKSTVVSMIAHILNTAGRKAHAVGNIGVPIISLVKDLAADEILIVELSSFQLMTMKKKSLDIGVILNITPDHIDWHGSLEEYEKAKMRIKELVKEGGLFLYPIENIEAVWLICKRLGLTQEEFEEGVSTFKTLAHRGEYVTTIDGIRCVNDSKATNVYSLKYALEQSVNDVVLICGGINKGVSMNPIAKLIESKCRAVVLIGESKELIASELTEGTTQVFADSMEDAIQKGLQHAVRGDILLLAPGCSSFDMFENYMARGNIFKKILRKGQY